VKEETIHSIDQNIEGQPEFNKTFGEFKYEINSAGVHITTYTGSDTSIHIPTTIEGLIVNIEGLSFRGLEEINSIVFESDNEKYTIIDGVVFSKDMTELLYYPPGKTYEKYSVPETVKYIYRFAFSGCSNLKEIYLLSSVEYISFWAFDNCMNLEKLILSSYNMAICDQSFLDCPNLKEIIFPDNMTLDMEYSRSAFIGLENTLNSETIYRILNKFGKDVFGPDIIPIYNEYER
jgi:hypothetical protein